MGRVVQKVARMGEGRHILPWYHCYHHDHRPLILSPSSTQTHTLRREQHRHNTIPSFNLSSPAPVEWLHAQHAWSQRQATARADQDPVWAMHALILAQLEGLGQGYAAARAEQARHRTGCRGATVSSPRCVDDGGGRCREFCLPRLNLTDFLLINSIGDLSEVIHHTERAAAARAESGGNAADVRLPPAWEGLSPDAILRDIHTSGRCSALIRVTPDLRDVLIGHSSW